MTQLDIHEAGPQLADLVSRVQAGEEIVIAKDGKPVARLGPMEPKPRIFGEFKGKIKMSDDFTAPLTDAELMEWEK